MYITNILKVINNDILQLNKTKLICISLIFEDLNFKF